MDRPERLDRIQHMSHKAPNENNPNQVEENTMARKSSKSNEEILAELERKKAAVLARQAREVASDSPVIQELQDTLESYSKDIAGFSRQLNGPQSFENRRQGFKLRLAEIDAGERLITETDTHYRACREYYRDAVNSNAARIAAGETVTAEELAEIHRLAPTPIADLTALQEAFTAAQTANREFIAARKADKNSVEVSDDDANNTAATA